MHKFIHYWKWKSIYFRWKWWEKERGHRFKPSVCKLEDPVSEIEVNRGNKHRYKNGYSSDMTSSCFHIHENKKPDGSTICWFEQESAYASKLATHFLIQTSAWLNCNTKCCRDIGSCSIFALHCIHGNTWKKNGGLLYLTNEKLRKMRRPRSFPTGAIMKNLCAIWLITCFFITSFLWK